jgi:hypothetical protein
MQQPLEYIYLDHQGIESLYAQIVDSIETSRVKTTQKRVGTKGRVGGRLKNVLVKMLSGLEGELSAEVEGSQTHIEQSTSMHAVEQKLNRVLISLRDSGRGYFFANLSDAALRVQDSDESVFISIRDKFNAPQFYGNCVGVDGVNTDGHLLLEKGGVLDYTDNDNYYRQPAKLVKLSASITKMRGGGMMGATSHEAIFLRGFGGRGVPLGIFGKLSDSSDYLQIKPFAIWK